MESAGAEVTLKIRTAITNKLMELGVYVDEELPDYIMVMVANKKSRSQMTSDLTLFLTAHTESFTKWLHEILESLQSTAEQDIKKLDALKGTNKQADVVAEVEKEDKTVDSTTTNLEVAEDAEDYLISCRNELENDDLLSKELQEESTATTTASLLKSPVLTKTTITTKKEPVSPPSGVSVVNPVPRIAETRIEKITLERPTAKTSMRVKPIFQRKLISHTLSSTVHRPNRSYKIEEDDEDEYDPLRPSVGSVASIVKVTERRCSVPRERQANKLLFMKAISDANKSIRGVVKGSARIEPYEPTPIRSLNPSKETITLEDEELEDDQSTEVINLEDMQQQEEITRTVSLQTEDNDSQVINGTMTAEAETQVADTHADYAALALREEANPDSYSPTWYREPDVNSMPSNKGVKRRLTEEEEDTMELTFVEDTKLDPIESMTQFVVTLDGVDPNQLLSKRIKRRVVTSVDWIEPIPQQHQNQVMDILEEDMEQDLDWLDDEEMEDDGEESILLEEQPRLGWDQSIVKKKLPVRCQFWPACKNGNNCPFKHPTQLCKSFPNCIFGYRCKKIHPNCQYDRFCKQLQCPFTHTSRPRELIVLPGSAAPLPRMPPPPLKRMKSIPCKFYPNCSNTVCKFTHPIVAAITKDTPCRYGSKCRSETCSFSHLTIPDPSKLKWVSNTHILNTTSGRRYLGPVKS